MDNTIKDFVLNIIKYAEKGYYESYFKQNVNIGIRNLILECCIDQCKKYGWDNGSKELFHCKKGLFDFAVYKKNLNRNSHFIVELSNRTLKETFDYLIIFPYFEDENKEYYDKIQKELQFLWDKYIQEVIACGQGYTLKIKDGETACQEDCNICEYSLCRMSLEETRNLNSKKFWKELLEKKID